LCELCDTLLTTGSVPSLPLLSMQPQQRRRWGSLYDALAAGLISNRTLEHLLTRHPLAGGEPIYAVDVSVWPRCDAETRPERALYYHAPRLAPLGGSADCGWLGVFLDRAPGRCTGELDGPAVGAANAPTPEHSRRRRRADQGVAA